MLLSPEIQRLGGIITDKLVMKIWILLGIMKNFTLVSSNKGGKKKISQIVLLWKVRWPSMTRECLSFPNLRVRSPSVFLLFVLFVVLHCSFWPVLLWYSFQKISI